jgi:hypothetical protein
MKDSKNKTKLMIYHHNKIKIKYKIWMIKVINKFFIKHQKASNFNHWIKIDITVSFLKKNLFHIR